LAGFDQSRHRHVPRAASNQAYIVSDDVDQADVTVDSPAALMALRGWISRLHAAARADRGRS